ncbi:MAG: hypothetical protein GH156_00510 [Dehalococcoidia bacterium]|nr:hypothetical protein [Dehalococcoidia bacterium]
MNREEYDRIVCQALEQCTREILEAREKCDNLCVTARADYNFRRRKAWDQYVEDTKDEESGG